MYFVGTALEFRPCNSIAVSGGYPCSDVTGLTKKIPCEIGHSPTGKNITLFKINDYNLSDTVFETIQHRYRDCWRFQLIICWYGDMETLSHHWSFVGEIDRWLGDSTNGPVMHRFAVSFVLVQMNCLPNDEVAGNPRHHIANVVSLEWGDMPLTA